MSYFSKFPIRNFLYDDENHRKAAVDILKKVSIREELKQNGSLFVMYQMKDSEKIWNLSERAYGRPDYHWIILLMNDIKNPFTDLPMSQNTLNSYIQNKYPGHALFFDVQEWGGAFQMGETIRDASSQYSAKVSGWDPSFRKLIVTEETGTKPVEGVLASSIQIIGTLSGATGTCRRRVQNQFSAHHFEDSNGFIVTDIIPPSSLASSQYVYPLESYVSGSQYSTGVSAVTNYEYEERLNDSKRFLKMLRPEYVDKVIQELETIFN